RDGVLPMRLDHDAGEKERRVALEVDEPVEREDDVRRGERVAVREMHVLLQIERERLCTVRGLPRRDEQRNGMRQVGLVVGEERVEDAAVDDRPGWIERALRIGRLQGE